MTTGEVWNIHGFGKLKALPFGSALSSPRQSGTTPALLLPLHHPITPEFDPQILELVSFEAASFPQPSGIIPHTFFFLIRVQYFLVIYYYTT